MLDYMDEKILNKEEKLKSLLNEMGRVLIAYSGGVDSLVLSKVAVEALGENVLSVISSSPSLPASLLSKGVALADELNIPLRVIQTDEFSDPRYLANSSNRCYFCKSALFTALSKIAREENFGTICYGANADDEADWRPGMQAANEFGIRAPLLEAKLSKLEIREMARVRGIKVWDSPAMPCTASRIPYGQPVTLEAISRVEKGEEWLRRRGFKEVRVRDHYPVARIEIPVGEMAVIIAPPIRDELVVTFKDLGYQYVSIDLAGFRSGSLNEVLLSKI